VAISGIVALNADRAGDFFSGLAIVIIVASAIYYFHGRCASDDGEQVVEGGHDERVEQIERRLTDTQDVMIALSEKVDRLEEEGRAQSTPGHDAGTSS
jgi:hypothetical protein